MDRNSILEMVNGIFRDIFDDESIIVQEKTTANDIEDWDSLEHINLILAIEQEFGIKFKMGEALSMKDVGEMIDIIQARTKLK
jgi:acyl carrier protein